MTEQPDESQGEPEATEADEAGDRGVTVPQGEDRGISVPQGEDRGISVPQGDDEESSDDS